MYAEGLKSERYFAKKCQEAGLTTELVHKPFDFLINGKYVEVKSAKFWINQSNGKRIIAHGQYECWHEKQLMKMKGMDVWICFIVSNKNGFLIQGFLKSKDFPNTRKITMHAVEKLPLKTWSQFLQYIKRGQNETH